jgi:dephospho-CoA kinase
VGRWSGKYVIGITGNIATGKSVVRRMLEHLGTFGIDADGLAHRAMSPGAPAYQPVVEAFGKWILDANGEINRERLGGIVFDNPEALEALEAIVHPVVGQAIDALILYAGQSVVAIEGIKLIEAGLADKCDALWVVDAPEEAQIERLAAQRQMDEAEAHRRMEAQSPQRDKVQRADVVIHNAGSFSDLWAQVQAQWNQIVSPPEVEIAPAPEPVAVAEAAPDVSALDFEKLSVQRGGPGDAEAIARFLTRIGRAESLSREDVLAAFGQKAYMLAVVDSNLVGLAGWQVENLVTRIDEFYLLAGVPAGPVVEQLIDYIEGAAHVLQSEVSLLFLDQGAPPELLQAASRAGYEPRKIEDLRVQDWREAALESQPPNSQLLTKKLRKDRVLRPL